MLDREREPSAEKTDEKIAPDHKSKSLGPVPSFVDGNAFIRPKPRESLAEKALNDQNQARLLDSIDRHLN